ncbi:di-/tripeptide transporter [Myroides odoratimimus]|uniref:Amino acid/peptide transporter (Peptide:H+ symporter) n=1 Tax=Myroides odoratimimus CCUG 10230 TaxID=883150 RepID=A0ABN0ECF6_9FLAO|nr:MULTISPECIES: peptide MFS transporter [Myroides]AJA68709.1 amino acid/peptide transporter (Peptide:H+ symporter), bacterial [Myroides sp. A21]EHO11136.1 amino acid/peptide transporter (Peptide:H+ symporter) [Myroides odoratimimus CCUG 10230]MDM1083866.1 peptide MFS transporter [Myroides odoratimimus]MDM1455515.1 peptide MFS transporter [Myroides odoratimimus]STZ47099.1 Di-/tripeptide transporter [Myroides odoratimimus]
MENSTTDRPNFFDSKVLGHPSGLFVLFFTEMWERFSFYGMRVLLIQFLTMSVIGLNPGWEMSVVDAGAIFATYAMLLYITPIFGGILADKYLGYRWAVVIGSLIMTLGHASMTFETEFFMYLGLVLLVVGTGFFKPNMTSILSEMYKSFPEKKDGAYTIFYMGVNAGAFFGMMLCGYIGERIGWHYGFGLAGIFMLLGTLQFWFAKPIFGAIGDVPNTSTEIKEDTPLDTKDLTPAQQDELKRNPFTTLDYILIAITTIIGFLYAFSDVFYIVGKIRLFPAEIFGMDGQAVVVVTGLLILMWLIISRIMRYAKVVRDRMIAVIIFAFFTIFFWMSFEQGATSLIIFARDNTQRILSGDKALLFNIFNSLLTIVPLLIISWVLILLAKQTIKKALLSNIILAITFVGVWASAIWMLNRDWSLHAYEVTYDAIQVQKVDREGKPILDKHNEPIYDYKAIHAANQPKEGDNVVKHTAVVSQLATLTKGDKVEIFQELGNFNILDSKQKENLTKQFTEANKETEIVQAEITEIKDNQVEITASWFSILNSFFIIALASLVSKLWDSRFNPPASIKYGLGLIIMAIGFGVLAYGSHGITEGTRVSMMWLVFAYFFHTLGELFSSPVGLSYVSKLVPARMIALMFGMWYLAIAIGNNLAATLGGQIETITEQYSLSVFFLIFTIVPIVAGLLVIALNPVLKKLMHGVK